MGPGCCGNQNILQMQLIRPHRWYALRDDPRVGAPKAGASAVLGDPKKSADGRYLCDRCRAPITDIAARTQVAGSHRHVFVNPHGYDFEIGCFDRAPGVFASGPATSEFSWFPGTLWRVVGCRGCLTHLGWAYGGTRLEAGTIQFFGLILRKLCWSGDDLSPGTGRGELG